MAEKILVNGVDVSHAVKDGFVVGETLELSDGRVIEVRAEKAKLRDAVSVGEALGENARPIEQTLALVSRRVRIKGGGILTPDEILDMDLEDGDALLEAALGKKLLSPPPRISAPSSERASTPATSKG